MFRFFEPRAMIDANSIAPGGVGVTGRRPGDRTLREGM